MPRPKPRLTIVSVLAAIASVPTAADDLPRPRLLLTAKAVERIEAAAASDPLAASLQAAVLAKAERLRDERTCDYLIPDGKRLLRESRRAIDTVTHTAMAWRLAGRQADFDRCIAELDAACGLPDWNPSHFLDTAEMATAVAIGLDWLWQDLAPAQRRRYRETIIAKAIGPWREGVDGNIWWSRVRNNWSQVCAGGIATAAVAVAESPAELAAGPLPRCLETLAGCCRFYEPDGAYPEGPGYADYGTAYHVLGLAAGEMAGHPADPPEPLLAVNRFMAHAFGPTGLSFNFADGHANPDAVIPARSWLAIRSGNAAMQGRLRDRLTEIAARGSNNRFFPLHVLWLPPQPANRGEPLPLAATFGGEQPLACFRTAWERGATYVAVKGGTPAASHGHMDVGSFVIDALGHRWVHDLGGDNYNLPGYSDFRGGRWRYFRLNARSHNLPLVGDRLQQPDCPPCPLIERELAGPFMAAVDLTPAFTFAATPIAGRMVRRALLDPASGEVTISDSIAAPQETIRWQAMIDADARLEGPRAVLYQRGDSGKQLSVVIEPADAVWRLEPARAGDGQRANPGFSLLVAEVAPRPDLEISVRFSPSVAADPSGKPVRSAR